MLKAADYLLYFDVVQRAEFSLLVINSVIVVMYLLFIFLIKYSSYFVKYLNVKLVVFLGGLTYPLYLVHQNASYILFSYFSGDNEFLLLFFLLIASFILSTFIYLIIEKKVHRKLSRFTHSFLNRVSSCKSALIFNTPNLSR
jgi:peptidoglycan/LPS O-acetylase OafA/YrhL